MSLLFDDDRTDFTEMEEEARHFLEAGGTITLSEWKQLTLQERGCLVSANRKLIAERSLLIATASEGPLGRASVVSEIDGGRTLINETLVAMIGAVQADMQE